MILKVVDGGEIRDVRINQGEVIILPPLYVSFYAERDIHPSLPATGTVRYIPARASRRRAGWVYKSPVRPFSR